MTPTIDFLYQAERHIRLTLEKLRPRLLEAQGNIEHQLKDDKSVVTEMDMLVEQTLRDALYRLEPGIAFSGEESGTDYTVPTYWLVDPIDGTEPFIRGLPFATNMVALIDGGVPVLGIIYNFALGDYYLAIKGRGATCNGHTIHVSQRPLDRAWLFASFNVKKNPAVAGLTDKLRPQVVSIIKTGAAGYEFCAVASGAVDARVTYFGSGKPYDFAPGCLIVEEAGGRIGNVGLDRFDFRAPHPVAANPVIFDQLMDFLDKNRV